MFDNPTDNHTDIEVPLYYKLRFTKLKNDIVKAKNAEITNYGIMCIFNQVASNKQ